MKFYLVECRSLLIALDDSADILGVKKLPANPKLYRKISKLRGIIAEPAGASFVGSDGYYHADGLACWRLLDFLLSNRKFKSGKSISYAFDALFHGNPTDTLRAILRIAFRVDHMAPGESGYYCREQWRNHPREMAAISAIGALWNFIAQT